MALNLICSLLFSRKLLSLTLSVTIFVYYSKRTQLNVIFQGNNKVPF